MHCAACGHEHRSEARFCEACGSPLTADPETGQPPPSQPLPAMIGGRYTPSRLLGEGVHKRVYLARDERLDREVAVALVKTEGLDDDGRARVAREARAMARLGDHALVVTVHDVGEDGGSPYIVSQYMKGGSVAERLAETAGHRLPVPDVLVVGEQVARALAHVHSHGAVHRDVKPTNVWIDGDGNAVLGDFGLAMPLDESRVTAEGLVVGTVAYLAPEQALGRPTDPRADLYSLGALLYECLCGRPPFLGDDAVSVIGQHINTPPVAPSWHEPKVPQALDRLVLRLLAKDPGERPASAANAAAALAELRELYHSGETPAAPATTVHDRPEPLQAEWGRFVGRVEEVQVLRSLFEDSLSGHTRVLMVVGEPGVGKTRLVEELSTYAVMRGAQVCWGHCYEGEGGLPYLPFAEALGAYLRAAADGALLTGSAAGLAEVGTLVPELRERLPGMPALPPLDGGAERLRLFEGIATFLRSAARSQPLVLILDDVHWADKSSLLLLQHLAHGLRDARLVIACTYRDVELDRAHPLTEVIANLRRQHLYERVLLRGLPREDVKALVDAVTAQEVPGGFVDLVFRETEGNPFFVQEILRHLVDSGAIRREAGRWVAAVDDFAERLPEGVREVIGRRLDSLSEGCNALLTVAATMPGGFAAEVAGEVAGLDEDTTLDVLDEALGAQVVRERRDRRGHYEFNHSLIRQTLYGELSTPRRARLHRRILAALEARFAASLDDHLPELAYHANVAVAGGDVGRAIDYAGRAAEQAMRLAAYDEAVRYYEMVLHAMELSGEVGESERADVLLAMGRAADRCQDADRRRRACLEVAALARDLDDPDRLADAAITLLGSLGPAVTAHEDREIVDLLEEAAARLRVAAPSPQRGALLAEVLARLSGYLTDSRPAHAERLGHEGVAVGRRAGDPRSLALALMYSTYSYTLEKEEYRSRLREAAELAEGVGDLEVVLMAYTSLMSDALLWADRDELDRRLADYARVAEEMRSPRHLLLSAMDHAGVAAIDGRYEEARVRFRDVLQRAPQGDPSLVGSVGVGMIPVHRELGRLGAIVDAVRRNAEQSPEMPVFRASLARVLCEAGDRDEAIGLLDELVTRDAEPVRSSGGLRRFTLAMLAETADRVGDVTAAAVLDEWVEQEAALGECVILGVPGFFGAVRRYQGLLAVTLGDLDRAVEHLEAALEVHERMRAPGWAARSRSELARGLVARRGEGDEARARALLGQALSTAQELGMPTLIEEALGLKLEMQGVAPDLLPTVSIDVVSASVAADRPDLRDYAGSDGQVTICFSDIVGYTSMTDRLGDARTHEVLRMHNEILRRALRAQGGVEVKSEGDGFMLVFGDPRRAVRFAGALQRALAARRWEGDVGEVRVRIGVHAGEVIRDADDFFGRTVIVGARVAAQAGPGEVLVTDEVRAAGDGEFAFGAVRELTLKGLGGTCNAHPVIV